MKNDLNEIQEALRNLLKTQTPPLRIRHDNADVLELCGTKEVMQGKQKVDGYYFASVMPKAKDIRFYFFPIYTHADQFGNLSEGLQKSLKGKSCFHIKKLDLAMETELAEMVRKGVSLYQADDLI